MGCTFLELGTQDCENGPIKREDHGAWNWSDARRAEPP
jgi:hypothetical protein